MTVTGCREENGARVLEPIQARNHREAGGARAPTRDVGDSVHVGGGTDMEVEEAMVRWAMVTVEDLADAIASTMGQRMAVAGMRHRPRKRHLCRGSAA